jgi:hypothetical protein
VRLPQVIASLDAEWVDGRDAEVSLPAKDNRLLSYQLTILNRTTGRHHSILIRLTGPTRRHRLTLASLLAKAMGAAIKAGVIDAWPETLALVAHFTRADLTTLRDWKSLRKKIDSVRRTFATTSRPLVINVPFRVRSKRISIIVADTMLLAPAGSSLKSLGETLGEEKIELRPGAIERMDLLMASDLASFETYALQDAVIAAKWADRVWTLLGEKLGVEDYVPTLGAAGVRMSEKTLADLKLSRDAYFGYEQVRRKRQILECLTEVWPFAANTYHGGRNEAYWVGHSPEGVTLYDLDLISAYTTAMSLLRVPDWSSAHRLTDISRLAQVDDAMTFARVRFSFPEGTRLPSLPCRAGEHGLIYPLRGTSWCTGPELVVALQQGAEIQVEAGWRVEWTGNDIRPFAEFTRTINRVRADAKASGDPVLNKLAKEVGNSVYGKIAQGVETFRTLPDGGVAAQRGKRVFDSRSEAMKTLPPSRITNPMLAATITGLVRAILSEALARLPGHVIVMTATTDGLLSSVPAEGMDTTGPLAQAFRAARERITPGHDEIWEEKHRVDRVIVTKTRGTFSVPPFDTAKPILVRAGSRLPGKSPDVWAECAEWVKVHRDRTYDTKLPNRSLIDLRTQWMDDADLIEVYRETRLNLDFDMKRALVNTRDIEGVLCADTEPWPTIEAFDKVRHDLESWKKSQRRVLKTTADVQDMRSWAAERPSQRAAGSSTQSGRPALVNAFLRAAAADKLGLGGVSPKEVATFVTHCGWPVKEQTVKDARRRGKLTLGTAQHLTAAEERFALMVFRARPDCELELFTAEGSPAYTALERLRQEAREPAHVDCPILDEVRRLTSQSEPRGRVRYKLVAHATPPYSASATLHCKTKSAPC